MKDSVRLALQMSLAAGYLTIVAASSPLPVVAAEVASPRRLVGGVTHSVVLPPLSSDEMVGKLFSGYVNLKGKTTAKPTRFRVPAWLAGVWQRSDSTEVSRVQLPSGRHLRPAGKGVSVVIDNFGSYVDAQGQIWQTFNPARAFGAVDRGQAIDYHKVSNYELVSLGSTTAVVEVRARHVAVNKKTKRIVSSYQDEELNTYSLITDGHLRTDSSVKVFDSAGRPLFLARSVSTEVRTAPFQGRVADKGAFGAKNAVP